MIGLSHLVRVRNHHQVHLSIVLLYWTWMVIILELQTGYAITRSGPALDAHGYLDFLDILE
jgi:hypothetical protein